jgi:hypothetical protein
MSYFFYTSRWNLNGSLHKIDVHGHIYLGGSDTIQEGRWRWVGLGKLIHMHTKLKSLLPHF